MQLIIYARSTGLSEFLMKLPMKINLKGTSTNGDVTNQGNIQEFNMEMYIRFRNTSIYRATLLNVARSSSEQKLEGLRRLY